MNKSKKRKICIVTGTRAEYGLLRPIMYEIKKDPNLKLQLVVTGTHLSSDFGRTLKFILNDGFPVNAKIPMTPKMDTSYAMTESISTGIKGMARAFKKLNPDIVLVLGDRVEALSAAIAAAYSGIYVAHIHGGDSAEAGLDENTRHAITKLSHIHFPATKKSARRIVKMGEDRFRIFTVGAPGLDDIRKKDFAGRNKIADIFNLDLSHPVILVVQHPLTTDIKNAPNQMKETLEAIVELKLPTIILYPNSDAGGRAMISVIESYLKKYFWIRGYKSISRHDYLGLLNIASVLVGNSSSGIIESPLFHIPVVNIGTRQKGRESSSNIINVKHDRIEILNAINKALKNKTFLRKVKMLTNPYGRGQTGVKIAKVLSNINLNSKLIRKKLTY